MKNRENIRTYYTGEVSEATSSSYSIWTMTTHMTEGTPSLH